MDDDVFRTALKKAMAICASSENCTYDIRHKLSLWKINKDDSGKIIDLLTGEKFIDDLRYARAFTRDKFRQNKWGRIKIASQLRMKEIPENIITEALSGISNDEYREMLKEILSSHHRKVKAKNRFEMKGKLMRYGLSKGFESQLIYDLLNEID